jgi:hypothetical protein
MKEIGYVDCAVTGPLSWRTHSLGMLSPHGLFIPTPGERENVSEDQFKHIGWVNPDHDGGMIYATHSNASEGGEARPAYIRQVIEQIGSRNDEVAAAAQSSDVVKKLTMGQKYGTIGKPTLFTISTDYLVKEVLEFCAEELDPFDGPDYDSDAEVCCQRSNVYLRELVGRITSKAIQPLSECVRDQALVRMDSLIDDLTKRMDRLEAFQSMPSAPLNGLTGTQQERLQELLSEPSPRDPDMSFYDHAFIVAYMAVIESKSTDEATIYAHRVAGHLTRNRANRP